MNVGSQACESSADYGDADFVCQMPSINSYQLERPVCVKEGGLLRGNWALGSDQVAAMPGPLKNLRHSAHL